MVISCAASEFDQLVSAVLTAIVVVVVVVAFDVLPPCRYVPYSGLSRRCSRLLVQDCLESGIVVTRACRCCQGSFNVQRLEFVHFHFGHLAIRALDRCNLWFCMHFLNHHALVRIFLLLLLLLLRPDRCWSSSSSLVAVEDDSACVEVSQ